MKPYTDATLEAWGEQVVKSVQVMSPAFSADCLETLQELALQNAETFQAAGGGGSGYIPALNARDDHVALLNLLLQANLDAFKANISPFIALRFSPYVAS